MAGNTSGKVGNSFAGRFLQYGKRGHRTGKQRRLRIPGQPQIIFRTLFHEREQIFAERIIHFIEDGTRFGEGCREANAHTHSL